MDTDPHAIIFSNLNNGRAYAGNFQVEASMEILKGWTMTLAYRMTDVKTTIGGNLVEKPLTNRYKGLVTTSYQTPLKKWQFDDFVRKIKVECLSHCTFLSVTGLKDVIDLYVNYYHHQRPNSKFDGGCIIEDRTQWHDNGEINQVESIPGLLNYYYRIPETQ